MLVIAFLSFFFRSLGIYFEILGSRDAIIEFPTVLNSIVTYNDDSIELHWPTLRAEKCLSVISLTLADTMPFKTETHLLENIYYRTSCALS